MIVIWNIGYEIGSTQIEDFQKWTEDIAQKFIDFKKLTGVDATLFDTPHVY